MLAGAFAFALLAGWTRPWTVVLVSLVVGVYVGLRLLAPLKSGIAGGLVGLVGSSVAAYVYSPVAALGFTQRMPEWINWDFPRDAYELTVIPLFNQLPWGSALTIAIVAVLASTILTGLTAAATSWIVRRYSALSFLPMALAWVAVAVLASGFLFTAQQSSAGLRQGLGSEPTNLEYSYDALIYLKTFYLMESGQSYYPAVVSAAENDSRFAAEGLVRDGKMFGFWPKPSYFRQPLPFQLWTLLANDGGGIMSWSHLLSAALLLTLFWGFSRALSAGALIVPMMIYPWLMLGNICINVLLPDWWAALALLYAVAFLAADLGLAALAFAFVATLMRFSTLPLLGTMIFSAGVLALPMMDRRRMLIILGSGVAGVAAFMLLWSIHVSAATPFVDAETLKNTTTGGILSTTAGRDLNARAVAPMHYSAYPYGFHAFPLMLLFVPALFGYVVALWKRWLGALSLTLFVLAWLVYSVVIGPTASYWGLVYNSVVIIGAALALATADRIPGILAEAQSWIQALFAAHATSRTAKQTM